MTSQTEQPIRAPRFGAAQIRLLEKLSNACAVSGDESEVRAIVLEQVRPYADEVRTDALGNVLAIKRAREEQSQANRLRVMLAAHMDEVGVMLTAEDGEGIFRFDLVGGIDERQLAGKPVWVGREHVPGVIGTKPIHQVTPSEQRSAFNLEALRIDLGPGGKNRVKVGDRATFATSFRRLGNSLRGKALDDRFGVALLIELFKDPPPHLDLCAAFTVQEEVGLRGARVAAYALNPDLAIILDATPALDLPHWEEEDGRPLENTQYNSRLDGGPAIYLADQATLYDPRLIQHVVETAERQRIPYQFRQPGRGATDAGAVHLARSGIPSLAVSVPTRYAHTPASIARLADWQNTFSLLYAALRRLTRQVLAMER